MNFLLVFFGGGVGCVLRYLIGLGFQRTTTSLPWATFFSNLSACSHFCQRDLVYASESEHQLKL